MSPESQSSQSTQVQDKPECSILFLFYNQAQEAEQILTPFLELKELRAELIIIDDGSTDETNSVIESLLQHYQHEQAYYFCHDLRRGVGQSLNEALGQASSETILYADKAVELRETGFRELIRDLGRSSDAYTVPVNNPALQPSTMTRHLEQKKIPASVNYLFRADRIRTDRMFFNPFIQSGHTAELLLRAGTSAQFMEASAFFTMPYPEQTYSDLTPHDAELILFQARHHAAELFTDDEDGLDVDQRYEKAFALKVDGRITEALQLCDTILKKHPRHDETIELKIELLQRLKQFVKASELKHRRTQDKQRFSPGGQEPDAETTPYESPLITLQNPNPDLWDTADSDFSEDEGEAAPAPLFDDQQTKDAGVDETASPQTETGQDEHEPAPDKEETEPEEDEQAEPVPYERPGHFRHSVVVPVTGMGLPFLENLMICMHEFGTPEDTELIVIDNASMDETWEYLKQLSDNHFFHIRVIQNETNAGFAASANIGIEKAEGEYIIIMHNDVSPDSNIPAELADILDSHPLAALAGPVTDCSMNEEQLISPAEDSGETAEISYLDSFCIAMRKSDGYRFREAYGPAWFDDMDLSMKVKQDGKKVLLAKGVFLRHYLGGTTDQLGLGPDSAVFYENLKAFNEHWKIDAELPDMDEKVHPLEHVFQIGKVVNPLYPFDAHVELLKELFTDEVQAELSEFRDLNDDALICFIRAMMTIDNRFMMRNLEEQLSGPLDEETGLELVQYYFDRNIFSRCRKHLANIKGEVTPARKLFELRIAWGEKDMEEAAGHLEDMLTHFPAHPEVNRIAGLMHQQKGNKEESESFFSVAGQMDPFRFPWPEPEPDFEEQQN